MAAARAAEREANAVYRTATEKESATQADLARLNGIAGKIEKGEPAGATLLAEMLD